MKLTYEVIHSAGTSECGFNSHQLELMGVNYPPPRGWLTRLIGKEIEDWKWELILELKGPRPKRERDAILKRSTTKT